MKPACEGLHVLKAKLMNLTSRSSLTCLAWIVAGVMTLLMIWSPVMKPEGLLWESWFVLNSFLMSWASCSRRGALVVMAQKWELMGLMMMTAVFSCQLDS